MKEAGRPIAVGLFDSRLQARTAIAALRRAGFPEGQIRLIGDGWGTVAGVGAVTGAALGGMIGAAAGVGVASGTLDPIGPAIAPGLPAGILASTALGGAIGGLAGAIIGIAVPEPRGGGERPEQTLLAVENRDRYDEAIVILRRSGGRDLLHHEPEGAG